MSTVLLPEGQVTERYYVVFAMTRVDVGRDLIDMADNQKPSSPTIQFERPGLRLWVPGELRAYWQSGSK